MSMQTAPVLEARRAGVLLHISSLPKGDFGDNAYQFIDFLVQIKASIWQILPLNMTHNDGSPYQCLSAHAGNPAFISIAHLVGLGLLTIAQIDALQSPGLSAQNNPDEAAYASVKGNIHAACSLAYEKYLRQKNVILQNKYRQFCRNNAYWINDFALFMVLRKKYHERSWNDWPTDIKNRQPSTIAQLRKSHKTAIALIKFTQFLFFLQWQQLKNYANEKGIIIFGDMPIFVAFDSADVWANANQFKLDANKNMQVVAGVPPDYFSETGQRWGNPHYDWDAMQADKFSWWLARMRTQSKLFDWLRIDHFRGLESAWEIPATEETALRGAWILAPGDALLKVLTKRFKNIKLIAEDLGIITPEVNALRLKYKLPSMKILQFAFGNDEDNPYLPANIDANSVVYTGTHDNDTSLGWYQQLDEKAKQHLHDILENPQPNMPTALVSLALMSQANTAIIPMQDILGLDSAHRMNTPGTIAANWCWRFNWPMLTSAHIDTMRQLIANSARAH
jgi:4-alpha-glucanotransferase